MSNLENFSFADVSADSFPMKMEFIDSSNGEVWHTIEVSGPGAVHIPACKDYGIDHTGVRITLASGEVHEER